MQHLFLTNKLNMFKVKALKNILEKTDVFRYMLSVQTLYEILFFYFRFVSNNFSMNIIYVHGKIIRYKTKNENFYII